MNEFILHIPELAKQTSNYNFMDDLIKVGFPSIVAFASILFTYRIATQTKKLEKEKYLLENNIKNIELSSDKLEIYFDSISRFLGTVGGIVRVYETQANPLDTFTDNQRNIIKEKDEMFISSVEDRNYALSRLHLLGASNVIKSITEMNEFIDDFRGKIIFEKMCPTLIEINSTIENFKELRNNIYTNINKFYKNI